MSKNNTSTDDANLTPFELRQQIRIGDFTTHTAGQCAGYVQANIVILPKDWAEEFLLFCQQNPKPCPLLHQASQPGVYSFPELGQDLDVRTDIPKYRVWKDGVTTEEVTDISDIWSNDLVTFFIGCSYSFEDALLEEGLELRHLTEGTNVPMYRTNIPCEPAGRFTANTVVSMRPFTANDAVRMSHVCKRFKSVHGDPIHFGTPSAIGIADINKPDFGDAITINEGEMPVFTACGVTPQEAIANAKQKAEKMAARC